MPPEIFQKLQIAEAQSVRKYVGSDMGGWHLPGSQAGGGAQQGRGSGSCHRALWWGAEGWLPAGS